MSLYCVKEHEIYPQGMETKELVDYLENIVKSAYANKHALMVEQMDHYRLRFAECEVTD